MDQPPGHDGESPLQHHDEKAPLEVDMIEHVKYKSFEKIIKEKYEEITELRVVLWIANSHITFLQQENLQLNVKFLL